MKTAYVRGVDGQCMDLPIAEALKHFVSDNGYRITFEAEGVEVVVRRSDEGTPIHASTPQLGIEYNAAVVIRS